MMYQCLGWVFRIIHLKLLLVHVLRWLWMFVSAISKNFSENKNLNLNTKRATNNWTALYFKGVIVTCNFFIVILMFLFAHTFFFILTLCLHHLFQLPIPKTHRIGIQRLGFKMVIFTERWQVWFPVMKYHSPMMFGAIAEFPSCFCVHAINS